MALTAEEQELLQGSHQEEIDAQPKGGIIREIVGFIGEPAVYNVLSSDKPSSDQTTVYEGGLTPEERAVLGRPDTPEPPPYLTSVEKASYGDPDKLLETIALEGQTNLPKEIIDEDPEEAKRQAWVNENGLGLDDDETKGTTKWLEDPINATVAKDDYAQLREIEKVNKQQAAYEGMEFTNLGNILDAWTIGMAKIGPQLMYWVRSDESSPLNLTRKKNREDALARGDQGMVDQIDQTFKENAEEIEELKDYIEAANKAQALLSPGDDFIAEVIHGGGTMALDLLPGMAISAITKGRVNPTLPFLTTKVFADSTSEALMEGRDYHEATRYGAGQAALEWVFEKIPTKSLEKIVGDLGGSGNVRGTIKKWMWEEGMTEQGAELSQSIHSYAYDLDEEMANASDWGERAEIQARRQAVTLFSTILGGGGVAATVHTVDRVVGRKQRASRAAMQKAFERTNSEQAQSGLDELFSLAQGSKTNERDAAYMESFLNESAPNGKIYMSADAVELMDQVPDYIQNQLDGSRADVVIPLSRFVRDFGGNPDSLNEVRRFIKNAPHLQTQEELEANTDSAYIKRVVEDAAKAQETHAEAAAIYDQVVKELVATGRHSQLTSRQAAQLIPAVITTQYEELKKAGRTNPDGSEITVKQLFEDMGLKIVGPQVDVASKDYTTQEDQDLGWGPPGQAPYGAGIMYSAAEVVTEGSVTLEDGRTYHKDPAYPEYQMVMVDAELLEEIWSEDNKVGPGPEFSNQISNRMEQYEQFLLQNDRGVWVHPRTGEEFPLPDDTKLKVGNAVVRIPTGYGGYLAFGDGRHRARAMIEAGMKRIPITMDQESLGNLEQIIATRRVLKQSDLDTITIEETAIDEDGNTVVVRENALALYVEQQDRMTQVEQLRDCIGG